MAEPSRLSQKHLIYIVAAVCIALSAWRYWVSQGMRSYVPDEGIYTLVGWSWLQGDWPYRDAWDHKGPVVFAVPLVRTALLGTASEMIAVQEIVLGLLTALFVGAAAARLWGRAAAAFAATASMLLWTQLGTTGGHMSTAGSIIGLLNAMCIYFGIRALGTQGRAQSWWLLALGAAGMLAFLAKPNAVGGLLAAILMGCWQYRKQPRRLLASAGLCVLGMAAPLLLTVAVFAAAGALAQMIDVAYLYNARVRGPSILAEIGGVELLKRIARGLLRLNVALLTGLTAAAAALALLSRGLRALPRERFAFRTIEFIAPLWLWLEIAIYASNGVYGHHVYAVLPAAAMAGASLLMIAYRASGNHAAPATLLALVLMAMPAIGVARLRPPVSEETPIERRVAERLARETTRADRGLVFARHWGPSVLAHAERRTAVRFFHTPGLYARGYASNARWDEVIATITDAAVPPAFIIITTWHLEGEPTGGPTVDWIVQAIDQKDNRDAIMDPTPYPSRTRLKQLITERYDVAFCESVLCVLRPKVAQPGAAS
jgi:hypothetical protein